MRDKQTASPASSAGLGEHRRGAAGMGRREFLKRAACAGAGLVVGASGVAGPAAAAPTAAVEKSGDLPMRVLGRTKQKVTILGLGTAPLGEGPVGVEEGIKVFGAALDRGINYVDTARIYGNAEEILGHLIPKRRDKLFVVTKLSTDQADRAEKSFAESLRLLKTDHVDLLHIHSIGSKKIDRVLGKGGVMEFVLKQKQMGKTRFIGITGHNRPGNFVEMLKTDQIDVLMCVMNYADRNVYDFESVVLPEAIKRNVGVAAMKVYVGIKGGFRNHKRGHVGCVTDEARMPHAMAYALDLKGVHLAVVGPYTVQHAIKNVEMARKYKPLAKDELDKLLAYGKQIAPDIGPRYGPVK